MIKLKEKHKNVNHKGYELKNRNCQFFEGLLQPEISCTVRRGHNGIRHLFTHLIHPIS